MKITTLKLLTLLIAMSFLTQDIHITCAKLNNFASFKSHLETLKKKLSAAKSKSHKAANHAKASGDDPKTDAKAPDTTAEAPKEKPVESSEIEKVGDDLPDRDVYFQGWVKYFHYSVSSNNHPNKFFLNSAYGQQMVDPKYTKTNAEADKKTEKDDYGSKMIPDDKHFFLVIYKDNANLLTSRDKPLMKVSDSMSIDLITTIPDNDNYAGGVKDMGKFSEGACIQVETRQPTSYKLFVMEPNKVQPAEANSVQENWLICSDEDKEKTQIMNILIKLKLKKQHKVGAYFDISDKQKKEHEKEGKSIEPNDNTIADLMKNAEEEEHDLNKDAKNKDGKWRVLQNWSQCTLKCGGGKSYLQLVCEPQIGDGKPCVGEAIREKPCNTQDCPKSEKIAILLPKHNKKTLEHIEAPIVKMMTVSKRPQRYEKCYLKDTDSLYVDASSARNQDFEVLPKIPIRLVMNNKSVSVYQDETLKTNLRTFLLENTKFMTVKENPRCFILESPSGKAQFCELDAGNGDFVEEWNYDFHLFKKQCKEERATIEIKQSEKKKLEQSYKKKMNQLKMDMVEEKAKVVKEQTQQSSEHEIERRVEETQAMTFTAVQKELKLEELLEKEEEQREKDQQQQLKIQLETEKKKNDCLMKSIKEKEIENQTNEEEVNATESIKKIKDEAKRQIEFKRNQIKEKISIMRQKNKRKLEQMQNDIINVRVETAGKVQKFSKNGDESKCRDSNDADTYCSAEFVDNYTKLMDCKDKNQFCYICCDNEFGEMHMKERNDCYKNMCEKKEAPTS